MLTLKESVRWLTVKGRHEEALESLRWIRGGDSAETQLEMEEIRAGVEIEEQAKEGFQLKGEFRPSSNSIIYSDCPRQKWFWYLRT